MLLPEEGSEYDLQFQHRFGPSWPRFWRVLGWILGPKTAPRPSQDASKTPPDASETPQTASKTPRACQGQKTAKNKAKNKALPATTQNLRLHSAALLTFFQTTKRRNENMGRRYSPQGGLQSARPPWCVRACSGRCHPVLLLLVI